jgi:mannose/cellobiose epimerase-like protein (N-acyl-D-glucosamine 2-epimerase family)
VTGDAWLDGGGPPLRDRPWHRRWLADRAEALFAFHGPRTIDPACGFHALGCDGTALPSRPRPLHDTTRMVHCHAIGHLLGRPGSDAVVDHGMATLRRHHRDDRHGGFFWSVTPDGPADDRKRAYGHAFVLLAAASATMAGHPDGPPLLAEIAELHAARFWDDEAGMGREDFARDWSDPEDYRGQNSNMHLTEALLGAHEATGERVFLDRARRIAERLIDRHARAAGWVVPEHFDASWREDRDYDGDPMFRPGGTTPGHALEWSRLLMLLAATPVGAAWMTEAAGSLFDAACRLGWDGEVAWPVRLWWPLAEGAAAASVLGREAWYRRIWSAAARDAIDPATGAWRPELDPADPPIFEGRPDLYHALGACLTPLAPPDRMLILAARGGTLAP